MAEEEDRRRDQRETAQAEKDRKAARDHGHRDEPPRSEALPSQAKKRAIEVPAGSGGVSAASVDRKRVRLARIPSSLPRLCAAAPMVTRCGAAVLSHGGLSNARVSPRTSPVVSRVV